MIDAKVLTGLKAHYCHIHPLIFHRSVERCRSYGDLFDILESLSNDLVNDDVYPLMWDEDQHRWVKTDDLFQSQNFGRNS